MDAPWKYRKKINQLKSVLSGYLSFLIDGFSIQASQISQNKRLMNEFDGEMLENIQ